jgi:hypothetical protein
MLWVAGTPPYNSAISGLGSSSFSNMGGEHRGNKSVSENYHFIPDFNDSLLSIPYNPAESEMFANSVAMSDASEWTLSAPTRAMGPSSAVSRWICGEYRIRGFTSVFRSI